MRAKFLAAASAALTLVGCGTSTKTVTDTTTVVQTQTQTQTQTVTTVKHAAGPRVRTVTATSTATAAPSAAPSSSSSGGHSFSGNGEKSVGTVIVQNPSTIQWTCSGCSVFEVSNNPNDSGTIGVASNSSSGSSAIDPDTYHDVQVISDGSWSFKITPG